MDLLTLGLAALVLPLLALGAVRIIDRLVVDSLLGARLVLGLMVATEFLDDARPEPVIAGFTVLPADIVFALLAVAALARLLRAPRLDPAQTGLVILGAIVVLSLVRGVAEFGLQPAVNESRVFLDLVFGSLYFSLSPPTPELRRRIGEAILQAAAALIGVVGLRWAVLLAGISPGGMFERAEESGIRVIDNPPTLVLAWVIFMLLPLFLERRLTRFQRGLMIVVPPVTLLLNHRAVWLAIIAGVLVVAVRDPRFGRRMVGALAAVAVVATVAILALESSATSPLPQDPLSSETLLWRYQGWVDLVAQGQPTIMDLLFGRPLGSGYERVVFGYVVEVAPHNWFLQTFLRTGFVGLVAFVTTFGSTVLTLARRVEEDQSVLLSLDTAYLLMVMLTLYLLTWAPDQSHSIGIGVAVALASALRHRTLQPATASHHAVTSDVETDGGAAA